MSKYNPIPIQLPVPWVKQQPWGEEITLAETPEYTFKRLIYRAGFGGGLQLHTRKVETFTVERGTGMVTYDDGTGMLVMRAATPGDTFHIPAGAAHKFMAISECIVYEASTNVSDDRVRLEKWYWGEEPEGLPSTSPEPTRDD